MKGENGINHRLLLNVSRHDAMQLMPHFYISILTNLVACHVEHEKTSREKFKHIKGYMMGLSFVEIFR